MDNITLDKVDYKKPASIYELSKIWNRALDDYSFYLDNKIILYLENFTDEKNIKERIMYDNLSYLLIKNNSSIGFIEFEENEAVFLINEFYILKEYKNETIFSKIIELIFKKTKKEIKLRINSSFTDDIKIFASLGFNYAESQIKYIGGDNFLKEEIYNKKIL